MRLRSALGVLSILAALAVPRSAIAQDAAPESISVEFRAEKIEDAMRMLADATGFNILVSSKATGTITAFVTEMDAEQALKQIVEVNGYHYIKKDKVVWVITAEEYLQQQNAGWERRIVPLHNARVARLLPTIQQIVPTPSGEVIAYVETNVLIVAAEPERLDAVEAVIKALDIPEATRVFRLQHAAAPDLVLLLQSRVASPEQMFADPRTNQISVTGTEEQLASIEKLLKEFDRPDLVITKSIRLRYAKADVLAELLREIITGRKTAGTTGVTGDPLASNDPQAASRTAATAAASAGAPRSTFSLRGNPAPGASTPTSPPPARAAEASPSFRAEITSIAPAAGETEGSALGPLANITADTRTNSVIITHTQSIVQRLEEVVKELDVPNEFHSYVFLNINPGDIDLESKLLTLFSEEGPYFNVDPLTRIVMFRCGPERADEILALLRGWDRPVRQVNINAEILRVNATVVQQLGVSWEVIFDNVDNSLGVLFPPGIASGAPQAILKAGNLADNNYTAAIQALATDNDTHTIANPRITVRDGQEAVFSSARDEPYRVVTINGDTQTTLEDVRFLNVGTNLSVKPTINDDDFVTIDVTLEISDLVEIRDDLPVVDRSTAQSSVTVKSGGMAVLGGLRESSRSDVTSGVPGLRKIPLFGALFRNRTKDNSEFEILLFLRPTIVGSDAGQSPTLGEIVDGADTRLDTESQDYKILLNERRKE